MRDAQAHCQRCHKHDPEVYTMAYKACAANAVHGLAGRNQSSSLTAIIADCADRFGMREVGKRDMGRSSTFFQRYEPCAEDPEEQCVVLKDVVISTHWDF